MEFRFNYKVRSEDLWLLSMHNIYRSMAAVVNIIFTVSMVLLAVRFWSDINLVLKLVLMAGILLIPVFQPLFILLRSRKIADSMPGDLEMVINREGILIASDENRSEFGFSDLKTVTRLRGMLILYMKSGHTYILGRPLLDGKEQTLFDFLSETMSK
jgi:hypothetical protein